MASVNMWTGIGNVCADPVKRYMQNGDAVTNITVACNETWKDKAGQKQEKTEFVKVVLFRGLAEVAGEYLKKGGQVFIQGRMETKKWNDKEGKEQQTTEIIASDMKMLGAAKAHETAQPKPKQKDAEKIMESDDIPF